MPARFQGKSLLEIARLLRTGDPARDGRVFRVRYEGLEVRTEHEPGVVRQRFITPVGEVTYGRILTGYLEGRTDQGLPLEHPLKKPEDYRVWAYVAEHTYYDPCYEDYLAY